MVTHPSTNLAWCRATSLIETYVLPLSQTVATTYFSLFRGVDAVIVADVIKNELTASNQKFV